MDYEIAKFWLQVFVLIINFALWLFVWNSNRSRVTNEKITMLEKSLEEKIEVHGNQMARMDERLKVAIGQTELKPVYDRINNMDKQLGEINGKMHTLDLIHECLMKGGK